MFYNKDRINTYLEEGISDPAEIIEDLFIFINEIFFEARERQVDTELQDLIDQWEAEDE